MASFLNTTANMVHVSRLPPDTTRAQALAMLSDRAFFLSCDPHLEKSELIPAAELSTLKPPPSVPDHVRSQLRLAVKSRDGSQQQDGLGKPQRDDEEEKEGNNEGVDEVLPTCYRVTDLVHAVPAGLWDTHVVSTYEFTDIQDGVFVRIRSPLSVVMDTFWKIRQVEESDEDGGRLELVEDVTVRCSRLLVGLVKGQCEDAWVNIHGKMIARLEKEIKDGIKK